MNCSSGSIFRPTSLSDPFGMCWQSTQAAGPFVMLERVAMYIVEVKLVPVAWMRPSRPHFGWRQQSASGLKGFLWQEQHRLTCQMAFSNDTDGGKIGARQATKRKSSELLHEG